MFFEVLAKNFIDETAMGHMVNLYGPGFGIDVVNDPVTFDGEGPEPCQFPLQGFSTVRIA